jgi:hypothetical protein
MALLSPDNSSSGYVAHVLSYISKDKPIVWFVKGQTNNINIPINETVLSVIFRYPSLQMAWLIFVYGIVLFLIFNAKRRQRTIPVIKPARNTTVEFVKTIANLYFQEGEIPGVVEKKIVYFLNRIRLKYYLDTSILNDSFVEKLHSKSGKDKELIRSIVSFINTFERNKTATQKELINFSKMVEKMWLGNDKHQHSNKR